MTDRIPGIDFPQRVAEGFMLVASILIAFTLIATCMALAACATPSDDPNPSITPSERMSLQNECVQIADRSERERCLENAAFAEEH